MIMVSKEQGAPLRGDYMKQVFQGIYHIVNRANGHGYVGQSVDINRRWKQEIRYSKCKTNQCYNYPLQRAFRKYGVENFTFTIVELVEDKNDLTEREIYYYEKLDNSYNQSMPNGGNGFATYSKAVVQLDLQGKIIEKHKSIKEASKKTKTNYTGIIEVCKGQGKTSGGFIWKYAEENE